MSTDDLTRAQWAAVFCRHPSMMLIYNPGTLEFLAVNEATLERYGYSRDAFLDLTPDDLGGPGSGSAPPFPPGVAWHRTADGECIVDVRCGPLTFEGRDARLVTLHEVPAECG